MVNNFPENDQWSTKIGRLYLPQLYQHLAGANGSYSLADIGDEWSQEMQQHEVDGKYTKHGKTRWCEHKLVQWPKKTNKPYELFCFETRSCTNPGYESEGWMHTCNADELWYGFEQKIEGLPTLLDTYVLAFKKFQKWFWHQDLTRYTIHTEEKQNRTRSVLISIDEVLEAFPDTQRYILAPNWMSPPVIKKNMKIMRMKTHLEANLNMLDFTKKPENEGEIGHSTSA